MFSLRNSERDSSNFERLEGVRPGSALNVVLEPLGVNNRFEVKQGTIKYFIDYNEVKFVGLCQLDGGILQAQFN
ncbi:MAG: hypothetical protein RLZZ239_2062, partial [Pseudomonadota bacterium]